MPYDQAPKGASNRLMGGAQPRSTSTPPQPSRPGLDPRVKNAAAPQAPPAPNYPQYPQPRPLPQPMPQQQPGFPGQGVPFQQFPPGQGQPPPGAFPQPPQGVFQAPQIGPVAPGANQFANILLRLIRGY